jgi:hypothetical protein
MELLGVSQSKAYKIMRKINKELEDMGYDTLRGRVSETRFREKYYYKPTESENQPPAPRHTPRPNVIRMKEAKSRTGTTS